MFLRTSLKFNKSYRFIHTTSIFSPGYKMCVSKPITRIQPKPLILLGGTFNPPHMGHIEMALAAQRALNSMVSLMPAYIPPDKQGITPANYRAEMTGLIIAPYKIELNLDLIEYERNQPSYTVDTMKILRAKYPHRSITFILGTDGLSSDWWKELLDYINLMLLIRHPLPKSGPIADLLTQYKDVKATSILDHTHGKIVICPNTPALDLSSTQIRKSFTHNVIPEESVLPSTITNYILRNRLYPTTTKSVTFFNAKQCATLEKRNQVIPNTISKNK